MKSFDQLFSEVSERAKFRPEQSKTVELLDSGVHAIGKKILEEAGEVWLAAEYESDDQLAQEISQLIYHLQVMMVARNIPLAKVYERL